MTGSRRRSAAPVAVLVAGLVLSACSGDASSSGQPQSPSLVTLEQGTDGLVPVGERVPAPPLSGRTLDDQELAVEDLRGDVVVVNFWASWCAPCLAEAGNLISVAEQTADEGVSFVGVNIKDEAGNARAFERSHGVPYPSISDQAGSLLTRFRTLVPQQPPTTLLLDREGRIAASFIGGVTEPELLAPVQALAAE